MQYFTNNPNYEIFAHEILSLELTEPTYRPFKNRDECWKEMLKHEPFGWVVNGGVFFQIVSIYKDVFFTQDNEEIHFEDSFENFMFADGTPFGIKEE